MRILDPSFRLPWKIVHLIISVIFLGLQVLRTVRSYFIASGLLRKYKKLDLSALSHLAVVIESEDAYTTPTVLRLLSWLEEIGIKHVSLYDMEGVLKKSKEIILRKSGARVWHPSLEPVKPATGARGGMTLEFISLRDGKEAVAKAANYLFMRKTKVEKVITESDVSKALEDIGCAGPDPELLLIFGPARCHLGFPAWRMRYTELVHMGPMRSLKYGMLLEEIHRYSTLHQNYGT